MTRTIGGNIAHLRDTLGYSQSSLARKANLSQSAVSQIESGDRNPSFALLLRIKQGLGVNWTVLLRGIE